MGHGFRAVAPWLPRPFDTATKRLEQTRHAAVVSLARCLFRKIVEEGKCLETGFS